MHMKFLKKPVSFCSNAFRSILFSISTHSHVLPATPSIITNDRLHAPQTFYLLSLSSFLWFKFYSLSSAAYLRPPDGSNASRNASPTKLMETTSTTIIIPGGSHSHGCEVNTVIDCARLTYFQGLPSAAVHPCQGNLKPPHPAWRSP